MFIIGKVQTLRHQPVKTDADFSTGAGSWMSHAVPVITPLVVFCGESGLSQRGQGNWEGEGLVPAAASTQQSVKHFHVLTVGKAVFLHT